MQRDMVERFTELELRFKNCLLYVHRWCFECVDWEEKISVCLVHVFRFKAHSDSRSLSVGETYRTVLQSMTVGIRELLKQVRCKPNHSDYYLRGWDRMNPHLTWMVVTTAMWLPGMCYSVSYHRRRFGDRRLLELQRLQKVEGFALELGSS